MTIGTKITVFYIAYKLFVLTNQKFGNQRNELKINN